MGVAGSVLVAMRKTNNVFCVEVLKERNFDALDRVYTQNARVLPPGTDMIEGHSNVVDFWRKTTIDLDIQSAALTTLETEASGDSVIEIGKAQLVVADGESVTAKYVIQWKQDGGLWKWHIDIWNSIS